MTRLEAPGHYDDERREIWADTVTRLTSSGRVFRADVEVLNTYVEAVRSHRQASRLLAQTSVLLTRDGRAVENPALAVQRRSAEAMTRASKALGLDRIPADPIADGFPGGPIAGAAPDRRRWCEEHKRLECRHNRQSDGGPCHQWRLVGGMDVCRKHGGKTLEELRAEGKARAIERQAARLLYQRDAQPVTDPLSALQRLAGRVAQAEEVIGDIVNDLASIRYENPNGGEQLRAEVALLERTMMHLGKLLVDIAKLGIEDKLAGIKARTLDMLEQSLTAALVASGCDLDGQQRAREAFRRQLKVVA